MQTHPLISKPKAGERRPAFWRRSFPMKLFGNIILSFYLCLAAGASMCGSGFIVQPNGYILTNYHVIKNATRITVTLPGRQEISAPVVTLDPQKDLPLLPESLKNLTTLPTPPS